MVLFFFRTLTELANADAEQNVSFPQLVRSVRQLVPYEEPGGGENPQVRRTDFLTSTEIDASFDEQTRSLREATSQWWNRLKAQGYFAHRISVFDQPGLLLDHRSR